MKILKRISKLISANINHMLDEAEDPEVMVKEIIRDMEASIIELRRETVRAIAREKQLQKQKEAAKGMALDLEGQVKLALEKDDEDLAKKLVGKKLNTEKTRLSLEKELEGATSLALQLKSDLSRLEDQVQLARRKKDELIRRKKAADAQMRTVDATQRSTDAIRAATQSIAGVAHSGETLETYEDAIMKSEAEAEAAKELLSADLEKEIELQKYAEEKEIEKELARIRGQ
jgi:phage shock protein A